MTEKQELRLRMRAITQLWTVPAHERQKTLDFFASIRDDETKNVKLRLLAAEGFLKADAINLRAARLEQSDEQHAERMKLEQLDRFAGIAQQLGLDSVLTAIAQERSGTDST